MTTLLFCSIHDWNDATEILTITFEWLKFQTIEIHDWKDAIEILTKDFKILS